MNKTRRKHNRDDEVRVGEPLCVLDEVDIVETEVLEEATLVLLEPVGDSVSYEAPLIFWESMVISSF